MNGMVSTYQYKYSSYSRLPAEYFVRMLKGSYPNLNLSNWYKSNDRVLDASCGDGRHTSYLLGMGFEAYGFEIDDSIVSLALNKLHDAGFNNLQKDSIRLGYNKAIPYPDSFFDGLVSWNQLYYLQDENDFPLHVSELLRVARHGAWFIGSFPMPSCFIYKNAIDLGDNIVKIQDDYFGARNNELMWMFKSYDHIYDYFSDYFDDLAVSTQVDDCFGLNYHWYLVAGRVK